MQVSSDLAISPQGRSCRTAQITSSRKDAFEFFLGRCARCTVGCAEMAGGIDLIVATVGSITVLHRCLRIEIQTFVNSFLRDMSPSRGCSQFLESQKFSYETIQSMRVKPELCQQGASLITSTENCLRWRMSTSLSSTKLTAYHDWLKENGFETLRR